MAGSTNVDVTTDAATLAQSWTVSDYTGTIAVEALATEDPIYGNYKVTLQYDKFINNKSSWILTIPAGKFKANNNQNALTKINFTIRDRAVWTGADTLSTSTTGYRISIDEIDGVATIVPTNPAQVLSILDASKIKLGYYTGQDSSKTWNPVTANYSLAQANEELKINADFSTAHTPYYLIFQTGAVKCGNTVFQTKATATDSIVARIDVVAGYTFVDQSTATEIVPATTKDDIIADKTYNTLTYKRKYTGKTETLYVPFDIKPTEENGILENVYIWKLVNITADAEGNPMFNFSKVENGQTVHANMPYLIRKKNGVAGEYAMTQTSVITKAPVSNSIESSTVTDTYTFTGIIEPTAAAGKWVISKSKGALAKVPDNNTSNLGAWRWYMTTTSKNIQYASIRIEGEFGDEVLTSIDEIPTETIDLENATIYNLAGQRMKTLQKGAINIVNGKKKFVK